MSERAERLRKDPEFTKAMDQFESGYEGLPADVVMNIVNLRVALEIEKRERVRLRLRYRETCRRFHEKRKAVLGVLDAVVDEGLPLNLAFDTIRDILDPQPSELMPPPGMGTRD